MRPAERAGREQGGPLTEADNVTPIRRGEPERGAALAIMPGQEVWTPVQLAALESIGLKNCPDADRLAFLHLCQSTGLDPFRKEIYLLGRKVKDGNNWTTRWTPQTGIDGFRHLAEETGVYGGRVGPHWTGDGETWKKVWKEREGLVAARCGVIRTDRPHRCRDCGGEPGGPDHVTEEAAYRATHGGEPLGANQHVFDDERITWAIAHWDEFVPMEGIYEGSGDRRRKTGEQPAAMWRKMPANQLGKCAEAAAVRAAFPRSATGLYEHAEMDAAAQAAKELEESERDKARRELASRPWAKAPGGGDGVVLDPTASAAEPTYDRTVLLAELEEQARAADKTVTQYTVRWASAHKKTIDQATDAELEEFLAARRSPQSAPPAPAAPETPADHGLTVESVPRPAEDASDETATDAEDRSPGDGQESLLDVEDPAVHEFEPGDADRCAYDSIDSGVCGLPKSDPVHFG